MKRENLTSKGEGRRGDGSATKRMGLN